VTSQLRRKYTPSAAEDSAQQQPTARSGSSKAARWPWGCRRCCLRSAGRKANYHGFALHLSSLLLDRLGKDLAPCVKLTFHRLEDRDLGRLEVSAIPGPHGS